MAQPLFANARRRPVRPGPTATQRAGGVLRRFRIDGRRAHLLLAVLATAAPALWVVSWFAVSEVVLWSDWSANAARAFVVIGPAFAAWAAMLASRDGMAIRAELLVSTATSRVRRELGHAALGVLVALACYATVAAVVLGYAARHATWGGPDWWVVLFSAAVTALYALAGWLIGTLVPGRLTPIVAGAGAFLYTVISYTWAMAPSGLAALQPWRYTENRWDPTMQMFTNLSRYTGMPHPGGGSLLACAIGGLAIAGYLWVRERTRMALIIAAVGVTLLVAGWALAAPDAIPAPDGWSANPHPAMTCDGAPVTVCLHQAYEAQLADAVSFTDVFYAPLVGLAELPATITQQPYWNDSTPAGTLPLNAGWVDTPVHVVMVRPMGHALMGDPDMAGLNASQNAILTWLAERAGVEWHVFPAMEIEPGTADTEVRARYEAEVDAAAERFAALPPEEQRAWLEANWDALRAGTLTLEDLP